MKASKRALAYAVVGVISGMTGLQVMAADVVKANNSDALNLPTSWLGGVVPGAADIAVWDASSAAALVPMGAAQTWLGVRVTDITGPAGISASNTLTLGNGGIDMLGASNNFTFGNAIATVAGSYQKWQTGAGRTLTFTGALSGANRSTVNFVPGSGAIVHTGGTASSLVGPWAIYDNGRDFAGRDASGNIVAGRVAAPSSYVSNPDTTVVSDLITGANGILNHNVSNTGASWRAPTSSQFFWGFYFNTAHTAGQAWDQTIQSGRTITISDAAANAFGIMVGPDVTTPVNFNGGGNLRIGNSAFLNLRQYNTAIDLTFNVNLAQRAANTIIEKTGPGRVIFNNEVQQAGAFNLLDGSVVVGGTVGAFTGTGGINLASGTSLFINSTPALGGTRAGNTINVSSGALVGGTGRSLGTTIINSGGTYSPGHNGIGSPTLGSLTLQAGSNLTLEFATDGTSYDTLNFTGTFTVNGGAVSLYQVGTTDPFNVTGLYAIASLANPAIGGLGAAGLTVANPVSGQTYQFGSSGLTLYLSIGGVAIPEPPRWNVDADGSWGNNANWTAAAPNGSMAIGTLGGGSVTYTGPRTVTLDGDKTVGTLNFDGTTKFTVAPGSGGTLNFNNGTSNATIVVLQTAGHEITAPIAIQSNSLNVNVTQAADTLTVGNVSGNGLTNTGAGTLIVTGDVTASNVAVNAGTIQVGNGGTTGSISSDVTVGLNSTLAFNRSDEITLANAYTGAGTVRFDGAGTVQLAGANTVTNYILNNGKLVVAAIGSLPGTAVVTGDADGGELDLNSLTDTTIANLGGGVRLTDSNTLVASSVIISINGVPNLTFSGSIFETNGKVITINRGTGGGGGQAASTWTGSSSYTGGTTLGQVEMTITNVSALGSGPVTLTSGNSVNSQRAFLAFGAPMTFTNNITVTGRNSNNTGMLRVPNADDNVTLTGNLVFNVGVNQTGADIAGPTGLGLLTIAGRIDATGQPPAFRGNVRSTYDYVANGASTAFSAIVIQSGNFSLGTSNAIPQNIPIDMGTNGVATFDLNGHNQTFTGVTHSVANANADVITNSSATAATLVLNTPDGTTTGQATLQGNLNVVKNNAGTQVLTAINTTGTVAINGGTVILNPVLSATTSTVALNASSLTLPTGTVLQIGAGTRPANLAAVAVINSPSMPAGTIELNSNDAIFRGATEAAVRAQVAAWWNNGQRDGVSRLMSATAGGTGIDELATLAVVLNKDADNNALMATFDGIAVTTSDVLVKYTYIGDTNLDGLVTNDDVTNLLKGIRLGLTGWYYGDTNYDGLVNGNDLANMLTVMRLQGASFGNSSTTPPVAAGGGAAVPEPAALGLLLAGVPLVGRRRRK